MFPAQAQRPFFPSNLTTVVWPSATWIALPTGPHPLTIRYNRGPVPWIELRRVGTSPVIKVWLGETFQFPFNGTEPWEVRAAVGTADTLVSAAGVPATSTLDIQLDVAPDSVSPRPPLLLLNGTYASLSTDAATTVWRGPIEGIGRLQFVAAVTTFAAGATNQIRASAIISTIGITIDDQPLGAVVGALNDVRAACWGDYGFTCANVFGATPTTITQGQCDEGYVTMDGAVANMTLTWQLRGRVFSREP